MMVKLLLEPRIIIKMKKKKKKREKKKKKKPISPVATEVQEKEEEEEEEEIANIVYEHFDDLLKNKNHDSNNDDDNDDNEEGEEGQGEIRMDKCEQLLGKSHQLYGCILYAREALRLSITNPCLDLKQLVQNTLDEMKLQNLLDYSLESEENSTFLDNIGFAYKPREHEIAMAITRLRGIKFEEIVVKEEKEVDDADAKMKALAELWKKRRSKKA